MRFLLTIFCVLACATSALAQYGVSNVRDANGNLIRNTGMTPPKGFSQGPATYLGPTRELNGPVSNVPVPTAPRPNNGAIR
jgi:hypothetical protein